MTSLRSLFASPGPAVGVEIAARRLSAALMVRRGGQWVVAAHAVEPLPPGAITPSLTGTNFANRTAVLDALRGLFDRLGTRPKRIGLVVPDSIAKVSLVRFDTVPARAQDLEGLIRWQVRRTAPFSIDEAQVAWTPGAPQADGGQEFVVSLARRSIVAEYEDVCGAVGAHAGIVDLATFNAINAVLAGGRAPAEDWLLVHVSSDYTSLAIVRGGALIFFRNRVAEGEGDLADIVHQTAMYYEDRLNGARFARVVLSGAALASQDEAVARGEDPAAAIGTDIEELRRSLQERLSAPVETIDPRPAAAIADRIAAGPVLLDTLAPLVGLILRAQEPAA
ncbi:MAG TPA: pilus assembly protein PilM [Vicinamibacterales bacterium]|nr:pilus assembly protein PilM [Vicinamibacterales bacterium]